MKYYKLGSIPALTMAAVSNAQMLRPVRLPKPQMLLADPITTTEEPTTQDLGTTWPYGTTNFEKLEMIDRAPPPIKDLTKSGKYVEVNKDCRGNRLPGSAGKWWKPVDDPFDKTQVAYHFPDKTMTKKGGWDYCREKGLESVFLWCPKSVSESESIWQHHTAMPLDGGRNERGIMTGIYRSTNYGDEYYCNYSNNTYLGDDGEFYQPLFKVNDYLPVDSMWDKSNDEPQYFVAGHHTNDIMLSFKKVKFRDARWLSKNQGKFQKYAFVCEMNCDFIDMIEPLDLSEVGDTHDDPPPPNCPARPWDCDNCDDTGDFTRKKRSSKPAAIENPVIEALTNIMDGQFDHVNEAMDTNTEIGNQASRVALSRSKRDTIDKVWGMCDFPDVAAGDSAFSLYNEDCNGPTNVVNWGTIDWYKANTAFYEKPNTAYHFGPMTTTKNTAFEYCQSLGIENVRVWCPGSFDESYYMWSYHPLMPIRTYDENAIGLWTGIYRREGDALEYICSDLNITATGVATEEMYESGSVQYWRKWDISNGYPLFGNGDDVDTSDFNDVVVSWDTYLMRDINAQAAGTTGGVICEWDVPEVVCADPECFTGVPDGPISIAAGDSDNAVIEILSNSPCQIDEADVEQLQLHGCHCWKTAGKAKGMAPLGGSNKLDELDSYCHLWHDKRQCLGAAGADCEGENLDNQAYQLTVTDGTISTDCSGNTGCMRAVCESDVELAQMIISHVDDIKAAGGNFTATVGTPEDCPFCEHCTGGRDSC